MVFAIYDGVPVYWGHIEHIEDTTGHDGGHYVYIWFRVRGDEQDSVCVYHKTMNKDRPWGYAFTRPD